MTLSECEHLFVFRRSHHRKSFQKGKDDRSILKISTGKLTYNKGMTCDLSIIQQLCKVGVHFSQMRDPYGCINKNHSKECLSSVLA